jgi:hypothetical protein
MLSYYYCYWQASRRVKESFKTVVAMQPDVPPMVEAQHEMNILELEYFRDEAKKFTIFLLTLVTFCVTLTYLIDKGIIDVYKIIG